MQPQIHAGLHRKLHDHYGCSDGVVHFKIKGFKKYILKHGLQWPSTPTGKPKTDEKTFNRMVARYPQITLFHEIFKTLRKAKASNFNVSDSRCYSKIWPFAQSGTRNSAKSNFIFGAARWQRGLIRTAEGRGLAYLDYGREEVLIQAVLANCPAYVEAYYSEDMHTATLHALLLSCPNKGSCKGLGLLASHTRNLGYGMLLFGHVFWG